MNPIDPWPKKQEPFKGLIVFAQIYAALAFVLIIVIFGITADKSAKHRIRNTDQSMSADIPTDTDVEAEVGPEPEMNPDNPMSSNSEISAAYDQAQKQQSANAYQYVSIRGNTPDTTPNREEIISLLQNIHEQTKLTSKKIEALIEAFNDTIRMDNSNAMTRTFFNTANRKIILKNELFQYREKVIGLLQSRFYTGNADNLRTTLPLDDISPSEYAIAWRNARLENNPDDALRFLGALDLEVANFEASAMNQFPVTVIH